MQHVNISLYRLTNSLKVWLLGRGVPIIGSADISAADMVLLPISVSVKNSTMTDIATDIYTVVSYKTGGSLV